MEIDFSEIYKNCVFRSNFQLAVQTYIDMKEKNIDVTSYIKRGMAEEITKKIEEKIEIRLLNFKNEQDIDNWYEKWINNKTGIKYPLPNSKHPPKVQLESEFCIFTKKELYELLYSFNKLPEERKEWVIKFTSPNKEEHLNQIRFDKLNYILSDII